MALAPRLAEAQAIEPRVLFISSVGYNDNVTNAPEYPKEGSSPPIGDGFLQLTPSASLTYSTPRASLRLAYTFDARLNATRPIANTYGNKVGVDAGYALDPRTDVGAQFTGKLGRLGVMSATDPATVALVETVPPGLFYYLDLTAGQSLTHAFTNRLRVKEDYAYSQRFTYESSDEFAGDPKLNRVIGSSAKQRATNTVTGRLEYDYTFDTIAPVISLSYQETAISRVAGSYFGSWKHDYQHLGVEGLMSQLDAGFVQLFEPATPDRQIWQPIATATVSYDDGDHTQLSAIYNHLPKANLITGQLSFVDSWTLRAGIPLDRENEYSLSGSAAYERDLQMDAAGVYGDPQHIFLFDSQASYSPVLRELQTLRFSLRWTRRLQLPMPLPRAGFVSFDGSVTNTFMLSVSAAWPAREDNRSPFILAAPTPPSGSTDVLSDSAPAETTTEAP